MNSRVVTQSEIVWIPTNHIHADPDFNARLDQIDETDVASLATSIKEQGLLQNLVVREIPGKKQHFSLISGFRRLTALKLLDAAEVPCVIAVCRSETDAIILNLVENMQRNALSSYELAKRCWLLSDRECSSEKIAKDIGKSIHYVNNLCRLRKLHPSILEAFRRNDSPALVSTCIRLSALHHDDQLQEWRKLLENEERFNIEKKERAEKRSRDTAKMVSKQRAEKMLNLEIMQAQELYNGSPLTERDRMVARAVLRWAMSIGKYPFKNFGNVQKDESKAEADG